MRQLKSFILLSLSLMLAACINTNRHKHSALSEAGSDTIVHSLPHNYMKAIADMASSNKLEISSYLDMLSVFDKLNYTPEAWQAGIRVVPRVYLTVIGDRWGSTTAKELPVDTKKRIFFRGIAPLILRANELIMQDRNRLEQIKSLVEHNDPLSKKEEIWIKKLAELYKVKTDNGQVSKGMVNELWQKVDIVPPSLALAQGAEESGWGTSRFASTGNAIYGQWTWGKDSMVPEQQRKELGNYGIAAFGSLQESVCAYMLNLNTHNAYAALRAKRAELRKSGKKISGSVLAEQLNKYSERGEEYVKTLKSLMEVNRLGPTDDAYLSDDPPLYLIPATS